MKIIALFLLLISISGSSSAASFKVVHLATLEWPPYTGESLKDYGASIAVAKAAFASMGYDLKVKFYPWQRAVNTALNNRNFSGYFPEYYAKDRMEHFIFSDPMGEGPLGFVEPADRPVKWNKLSDLEHIRIGTVNGYVNTEEFDRKAVMNELDVRPVINDLTNLKKLLVNRIDIAVMDKYVFQYLINTDRTIIAGKTKLQFNKTILDNQKLYICFRKNKDGEELARIFNEGLKRINYRAIQDRYISKVLSEILLNVP